jgi:two-component system response regulator YesN
MKYTIMLVEDEPPILYAIKHLIETGNYGFSVIATAPNGREALKALETYTPDIIITDIQMPFVNGLDLIDEVHRSYPQIKCVILTGHSDFEYARKALRSNAFEYLLKPIQVEQLRALLQSLGETLTMNRELEERTVLSNAIFFEEYSQRSLASLSGRGLAPMIICAGHYAHEISLDEHPGKSFWDQVENQVILHELSNTSEVWVLNGFIANEKIVIIDVDPGVDLALEEFTTKLMQQFTNGEIPIHICYGDPTRQLNELSSLIKKLREELARKNIFGKSGIYSFAKKKSATIPFIVPSDYEKRFDFMAKYNILDLFKKDFQPLLKEWEAKQYEQASVEVLLQNLTIILAQGHHTASGERAQLNLTVSDILSRSSSYSDLYENYCSFIRSIFENSEHIITNVSAAEIVEHMETYFQNNFTSVISYKMFYDLFGFNETYLSHVFKVQRGITPNKYVTKLRIEKAKEVILLQPDIPLKKIAALVGYDDAFYFSRVFKETIGISPTEFIRNSKNQ